MKEEIIDSYSVEADGVVGEVTIVRVVGENVPVYSLKIPTVDIGTEAMLDEISEVMAKHVPVTADEVTDPRRMRALKKKFYEKVLEVLREKFKDLAESRLRFFAGVLIHKMYGLGDVEVILADDMLEEVAINSSVYPITVFHKKYGWLKTTKMLHSEIEIYNFSAQIGRKVGRQITTLTPIMDAHLLTGDRVASTLFPVSTLGNTITIRKFSRNPWTIIGLIENGTTSLEIIAFLWLAIQYEINILIAGGTASGKTSFLNALTVFIPPSQRIISIEDTREIELSEPQHWNWVPLGSRSSNPEGQGEVTMLDLMIASLRMRPDRIIVGEVRSKKQAETLFEAMHTGHSVYTTMHADTVEQMKRRLLEEPIGIPKNEVEALQIMVVQHRDRRKNVRKTLEVAEIMYGGTDLNVNYLFRYRARTGNFTKTAKSERVFEDLNLHVGLTTDEIEKDLEEKEFILKWMINKKINKGNQIGKILELYYRAPTKVLQAAQREQSFDELLTS
jgi:archaeal flagellar protein FlaI